MISETPNTRMHRTRALAALGSLPSVARSPVMRSPLGGMSRNVGHWSRLAPLIAVAWLTTGCNDTSNILTIAVPADVLSFEIAQENGTVLWRIESSAPQKVSRLRYGQLPSGFRQVVPPPPTHPRPLKDGEGLVTITVEPARTFTHRGNAVGSAGFLGGGWQSSPKSPPTAQASHG